MLEMSIVIAQGGTKLGVPLGLARAWRHRVEQRHEPERNYLNSTIR